MKKIIFLYLFFVICLVSKAQHFAPVGASWHYTYSPWNEPPRIIAAKIESIKDTVIIGIACRNLYGFGIHYMYSSGKKIFLYDEYRNTFVNIYNFDLNAGDSLQFRYGWDSTWVSYRIDSISYININSKIRKVQHTSNKPAMWMFFGNKIEGIGDNAFLFPQYAGADPHINMGLRCYQDSILGYYNSGMVANCDSVILLGIDEIVKNPIKIYPNPATNEIFFNTAGLKNYHLFIFNAIGKCVLQKEINNNENRLDITDYNKGIYFYRIIDKYGKLYFGKFVRN